MSTSFPAALRVATLLAAGLGVAAGLVADASAQEPAPRRPNILFVFSDDHACHAISAYGSAVNETPHIDRLAREGVLFRNSFCGNSLCGPSRATVLTGLHSHAHGFMRNGQTFDASLATFPQQLHGAGYRTALFGKWHLAGEPRGFDTWEVLPGQGHYYNPDFRTPEGTVRVEGYVSDLVTDRALAWLDGWAGDGARGDGEAADGAADDAPFLLMVQHKAPHRSWMPGPEELPLYRDRDLPEPPTLFDDYAGRNPAAALQEMEVKRHLFPFHDLKLFPTPEEAADPRGPDRWTASLFERMTDEQRATWDSYYEPENAAFRAAGLEGDALVRWKYQRYIKNYLRSVAGVDKSVGRLLAWLDEHPEVSRDTVVVYSSDQGFYLGDHGWYDKRWMYEESLRMPLLLRWPAGVEAGREVTAMVQNIDYAPTFLELAGLAPEAEVHGRSLVPLLRGDPPDDWRDAVYYHYFESRATHNVAEHWGVRTATHKLIRYPEPEVEGWELFDLERDPHELTSVADEPAYAAVRAELEGRLEALREHFGDTGG